MTTMENPQPDTADPGNELTAEATEHAEIFSDAPDTENSHLERAYQLQREEDFETALQECAQAIEDVPTLAEAYNLRSLLLEQLDRPEQALEAYRRAVELDAEWEDAWQNFQGLQEELREASYRRTRGSLLKVILTGAAVYGILYVLYFFSILFLNNLEASIVKRFQVPPLSGFLAWPVIYGPAACAIGVGAFIIGKVARFKQALWLGVASGLGYLVACSFTGVQAHDLSFPAILQYALIGAFTGLGFGLVKRTKPQLIYSTLAGIIGFSLQNLLSSLWVESLRGTVLMRFFIEGALIGAIFGYVLTLYRLTASEASDHEDTAAAVPDTP